MSDDCAATVRVPRKRVETRRRLLIAGRALLAEHGLAGVGADAVAARGGYTRGAFYSNFASMDDLVLALYDEHTSELIARLDHATDHLASQPRRSLEAAIREVVVTLPFDIQWLHIRTGLAAQAVRDPAVALRYFELQQRFLTRLQPILIAAVHSAGRHPTVEESVFTRAMMAAHDGALSASFDDSHPDGIRVLTCTAVAIGLTRPDTPTASPASQNPEPGLQ